MKSVFPVKWLLIALPLFYTVLSVIYLIGVKQFSVNHNDGPYVYLMNGTNLASGHLRVGNIEHPGVSGDCYAGIVVFIKHLFSGGTVLYQDVLLHPESYLFACSIGLTILLALVTYISGEYVFRNSGNIGLALLFQAGPLFFSNIVKMTVCLNAESFITIYGVFFTAYLYINTIGCSQNPDKTTTNKSVLILGLLSALLITTKIYCAPVILFVLFIIKKRKQKLLYLVFSGIFSIILLFPLYNQLRNWLGWIKSLIFHNGAYGQGSSGIIDKALYKNNIIEIFSTHYIFLSVYIFVIAAFLMTLWNLLKKRRIGYNFISPITGILVFFTLFILVIAKQYKVIYPEPLTHEVVIITKYYYFIPLLICFPYFIAVSYEILSPFVSFKLFKLHKQKLLYCVLFIFIIWAGQNVYGAFYDKGNQYVAVDRTQEFLGRWKNTPLIIVSDGNKACVEPALFIGISYSGRWDIPAYFGFMKTIYPNSYIYTTYDDALRFWDGGTNISTILKKNNQALIYLSGTDSTVDGIILSRICEGQAPKNKLNCKKVYSAENKYENIYLLKADTLL